MIGWCDVAEALTLRKTTDKAAEKLVINSSMALSEALSAIQQKYRDHRYLVVSIRPGKDRSADQNRLWRRMYNRIAAVTGQGDDDDAWADCKLYCGVPILRRDDEQFEKGWTRYFAMRSVEEQLFLMGSNPLFGPDGFPVTRLFGTAQGTEYTQRICDYYAPHNVLFDDILERE